MIALPILDALDSITIPVACPVSWDAMRGDDRTRFCDNCSQNVHDVSELTREEALQLVTGGEPPPCLRIYRRQDGRVMTADCSTRRERVWKWLHKRSPRVAWLFALGFFMGCGWRPVECTAGIPIGVREQPTDEVVQSVAGGPAVVAMKNQKDSVDQ